MRRGNRLTKTFAIVLRIGVALNYASGLFFAGLLVASAVLADHYGAHLLVEYGATLDVAAVIAAMRVLLVGGLIAVWVVARLLAALRAILASVAADEPFAAVNAPRLLTIGWMLLALQLLDLLQAGVSWRLAGLGVEVVDWTPSFTGWLAVLVAFVLARVFAAGAAMRDDLEGTV